jgi:LacI family transcriptional regulator
VARELGLEVSEELTVRLETDSHSPAISYPGIRSLVQSRRPFTAVLCFNDVSAMGSIRALHEAGLRVPQDVSILGFDDIQSAEFQVPSLTTIRQPLQEMGSIAARMLLKKLHNEATPDLIHVDPGLVVRESTAPPAINSSKRR